MVVGKIGQYFDRDQKTSANMAFAIIEGLYESNDNACTYAMTGLLTHLLRAIIGGHAVFASSYANEKIKIIEGEAE